MKPIQKLLIANRGEIAIRVMRTAREMGIATVAVASDPDLHSRHAKAADEVIHLPGSSAQQTYLQAEKILAAARETGADAVHPGYGFLSERAEFAEAVEQSGVRFIGPPGSAMRALGDKISAKKLAEEAGVPLTPGYFEPGATDSDLAAAAEKIGFPVMLKASAGGGGRGMRVVESAADFAGHIKTARSEALQGFGDDSMMVEKLVRNPRHVEVQIVADQHGTVAALYERECSIQRRHQKIIEEAPSPIMTPELWERMRVASIDLAHRAGYVGAGTVEFMVDSTGQEFYFLEVNARLQVEHPVTEAITGLDLVRLQLEVAMGARLEDLIPAGILAGRRDAIQGHAIEVRVVSEDPSQGFLPSVGPILAWSEPVGPGVRVDTGYGQGSEVTPYYDSLLAKLIVHANDRTTATSRLEGALRDFHVLGVKTNLGAVMNIVRDPDFESASFDTGFLGRRPELLKLRKELPSQLGSLMAFLTHRPKSKPTGGLPELRPAWNAGDGFRNLR